ncbi:transglycosylase SLT domain-containing protein [Thermosipho globiformans]|uniref:transglycosylase SLT domain-containing protein n=1 Tax=Thermosipho globiformans TaxID=380685 RepID=UPI000F8EDC7D|nr:transglycosylase SLT domain-containing protein [Thermosipho globiformans]
MRNVLEEIVEEVCKELNLDPKLVKAIISTESDWEPKSDSGIARGLMGVSKIALEDINNRYKLNYTYEDMYKPKPNIVVGCLYLKWLLNYFKTRYPLNPFYLIYALMAYNWGIGNVRRWLEEVPFDNSKIDESVEQETKNYLTNISKWYKYFCNDKQPLLK